MDFLFIDTAPQSDKPAINAAAVADIILIACKPSVMDLWAIQNTLRLTKLANLKPEAKIFTVLTQIEPFGKLHEEARTTLRKLAVNGLVYLHGRTNPESQQGEAASGSGQPQPEGASRTP